MKKSKKILILITTAFLLASCGNSNNGKGKGTVPVYEGMSISRENSAKQRRLLNEEEPIGSEEPEPEPETPSEDGDDGDGEYYEHEEHDVEVETEIEELVTIDVNTDEEIKYYVQPNETFIIEVHLSNPDNFEIQSFTLNGNKYANYMFEYGSNMELLLLKTTAPSEPGYYDYTIDAIKYIDGTTIKDVDMSQADKRIKSGIIYDYPPTAEITGKNISTTSAELTINVDDFYCLLDTEQLEIYLTDGEEIIEKQPLELGINSIKFENLEMSKAYQFGVSGIFDLADGRDTHQEWLCVDEFITLGAYTIENVIADKETISFDVSKVGDFGDIKGIKLYDALTEEVVLEANGEARTFEGLLSDHEYTIILDFSYAKADKTIEDWVGYANIKTLAKTQPIIKYESIDDSSQDSISYVISTEDEDGLLSIEKVDLLLGEDLVATNDNSLTGKFEGLLSDNVYSLVTTYQYDLNNGEGIKTEHLIEKVKTGAKAEPAVSIVNTSSTKTSISCGIDYLDEDKVLTIDNVQLMDGEEVVETKIELENINFEGLNSGHKYTINVNYHFDLNDGVGVQNKQVSQVYTTLVESLGVTEIVTVNTKVVKTGEEIDLRVFFDNPSEVVVNEVFVNNQPTEVIGGDRITNVVVKFVPTETGLVNFSVNKVTYTFNETQVSQLTNTEVSVEYPIYTPLKDTKFIPITASLYGNDAQGLVFRFDNEYGYTIESINGNNEFTKIDKDTYLVRSNRVMSIDYCYEGFGTTTQNFQGSENYGRQNITSGYSMISTPEEFLAMTDGYYMLANDIDLSLYPLQKTIEFSGYLIGNGHKIINLSQAIDVNNSTNFSSISGGSFFDVKVENLYLSATGTDYVSPLGNTELFNCEITGDVVFADKTSGSVRFNNQQDSSSINVSVTYITEKDQIAVEGTKIQANEYVSIENGYVYFKYENLVAVLGTFDHELESYSALNEFYIGNGAFVNCSELKELYLNDLCSIGLNSFAGDNKIANATIPASELGRINLSNVENLTINGSGEIADNALIGNRNLLNVVIGEGITSIGVNAFSGCSSLSAITIPSTVTEIKEGAINNCDSLSVVFFPGTEENWNAIEIAQNNNSLTNKNTVKEFESEIHKFEIVKNDNYSYLLIDDLYVYGFSVINKRITELDFATELPGLVVKSLGFEGFKDCAKITSISIPSTVKVIPSRCFNNCVLLNEVTIPSSIIAIESYAFENCGALEEIIIPNTVETIGQYAFSGCNKLENVSLPEGLTVLEKGVFAYCNSLREIKLPAGLVTIGENAFASSGLITIEIPASVTEIGEYAFNGCNSLRAVNIPDGITAIGKGTFQGCTLMGIILPASLETIDRYAFSAEVEHLFYAGSEENWKAISVDLDENVLLSATICEFDSLVKNITYAETDEFNVLKIDDMRAMNFKCLDKMIVEFDFTEQLPGYTIISFADNAFEGCENLFTITIPEGLVKIGPNCFSGCTYLASITIPASVKYIDNNAFSGCKKLKDVIYVENNIETIGNYAFSGCVQLVTIEIGSKVKSIGEGAFNGCKKLKSVTIPDGFESILKDTFNGCAALESITIPSSVTVINENAFKGCASLESVTIPEGVKEIKQEAFSGCTGLKTVVLPAEIDILGNMVFVNCTALESINMPETIVTFGDQLFQGCSSLKSLTIPEGVTIINERSFTGCSSLETINLPSTLTFIANYGFYSCTGLKSIVIPEGVTFIGTEAFDGCTSLVTAVLPSTVTTVGARAFNACSSLRSINFPEGITVIELGTLQGCISLETVVLPSTLKSIKNSAFNCQLSFVYFGGSEAQWKKVVRGDSNGGLDIVGVIYYFNSDASTVQLVEIEDDCSYTLINGNKVYNFKNLDLTIESMDFSVKFPEYSVYSLADEAFYGCDQLQSITIPNTITAIPFSAFNGCSALTSLVLPDTIKTIEISAFEGCSALASINLQEGIAEISNYAFYNCSSLATITLPSTVTKIGNNAFYGCSALASINIPEGVTSIGDMAFELCTSLTEITLPSSLKSLGMMCFAFDSGLRTVTFRATSAPKVGTYVFNYLSEECVIKVPADSLSAYKAITTKGWSDISNQIVGE